MSCRSHGETRGESIARKKLLALRDSPAMEAFAHLLIISLLPCFRYRTRVLTVGGPSRLRPKLEQAHQGPGRHGLGFGPGPGPSNRSAPCGFRFNGLRHIIKNRVQASPVLVNGVVAWNSPEPARPVYFAPSLSVYKPSRSRLSGTE
ncbi:hypothetical protein NL676_016485 [Syzygium grande]|nr:hypothetical protein NL676_016485 [Syzygium grande]